MIYDQDQIFRLRINLSGLESKDQLHDLLALGLKLPPYYGRNLDALYDSLTTSRKHRVLWLALDQSACSGLDSAYIQRFLATLEDAAAMNPRFIVIYIRQQV